MPQIWLTARFALVIITTQLVGASFPIRIDVSHRHFVDSGGNPWLMNGGAAWMMFCRLTQAEAETYLDHRRAQGFNAVTVQLLSEDSAAKTRSGLVPFADPSNLASINSDFFDEAANMTAAASRRGMVVAIAPAWLGCCSAGGRGILLANGPAKCRKFGEFVGSRFSGFQNVMWILGGDHDPNEYRGVIDALAEGIRSKAPGQLMTAHAGSPRSASEVDEGSKWLDVNSTYTYSPEITSVGRPQYHVYAASTTDYNRTPVRPFILIESAYENDVIQHHK